MLNLKESHTALNGRLSRIEYKKHRAKTRKRRDVDISNKLHEVHRPYWQRHEETKMNFDLN